MKLTKNLITYSVVMLIINLLFFTGIEHGWLERQIDEHNFTSMLPFIYVLAMIVTTNIAVKTERIREHRSNINLQYHVVATITVLVGFIYGATLNEHLRELRFLAFVAFMLTASLLIHIFTAKRSIKGFDKKELFK